MSPLRWLLLACITLLVVVPGDATAPAAAQSETSVTFAVIGDYGSAGNNELAVANLVKSWNPAFIITTGDNNYPSGEATTIDRNIGQYYHAFIAPYTGSYGAGADVNRFFPSMGNHDWVVGGGPYQTYFTLPGNERYYTTTWGPIGLFALDSDPAEPDGITSTSVQAQWLQASLAASTACWNLVYFHHPPYSSGLHGSNLWMHWPFEAWGADAVLAGHDHSYERIMRNGFPYIVNGLGGASRYGFGAPVTGSVVRYVDNYGAMRVTASMTAITYEFINVAGGLIDTYTQTGGCAPPPTPPPCCDFDNNGRVDIGDIQRVAADWDTDTPVYDFNGNGRVDMSDLMYVVNHWQAVP